MICAEKVVKKIATAKENTDDSWRMNLANLKLLWLPPRPPTAQSVVVTSLNYSLSMTGVMSPSTSSSCLDLNPSVAEDRETVTRGSVINTLHTPTSTLTHIPISVSHSSHVKSKKRLLIFIPSMSISESIRLHLDQLQAMQNMSIGYLYQLIDPNVHVVYVSPIQFTPQELSNHTEFLSMIGIDMTGTNRLHFIVPELMSRLPAHMPLSQILWYSTTAIRKIKNLIKTYPNAVLIPSTLSWAEKKLSSLFNVPLLSPDPGVATMLENRSFIKKVR